MAAPDELVERVRLALIDDACCTYAHSAKRVVAIIRPAVLEEAAARFLSGPSSDWNAGHALRAMAKEGT